MVKQSFSDQSFLPEGRRLVAVNSINWARIMAQIVYYFHAALALGAPDRAVSFSVPTGNFGDIYAGYLARRMGLPVQQLVIATNANDILHRFMSSSRYGKSALAHTLSPSMDIVISSNFERALFEFYGRDAAALADLMQRFRTSEVAVPAAVIEAARAQFASFSVDDAMTCATIAAGLRGVRIPAGSAFGDRRARRARMPRRSRRADGHAGHRASGQVSRGDRARRCGVRTGAAALHGGPVRAPRALCRAAARASRRAGIHPRQ